MNLIFEWLANGVKETGTSNWFSVKPKYSSDVRLAMLEPKFPMKWLWEISNFLRDVMWTKDEGSGPSNALPDRSNNSNFFSLDQSEKWNFDKQKNIHLITDIMKRMIIFDQTKKKVV